MSQFPDPTYGCFVLMDSATLKVLPGGQTKEAALEQMNAVCRHMMQFPGGTQSVSIWIEPD